MSWAFSQDRGYQALAKRNLFGFRLTNPHNLAMAVDRIGAENEPHLLDVATGAGIIVAAWANDAISSAAISV